MIIDKKSIKLNYPLLHRVDDHFLLCAGYDGASIGFEIYSESICFETFRHQMATGPRRMQKGAKRM